MAEVVGVICEYDPFHLGHARQFALIREKAPEAKVVCVMSGCFTQRGMPALYAPAFRARAALEAGADLVLELPALFAVREAEHFALGGVSLLHQLGFVTHISFGCETEGIALLQEAADALEQPSLSFLLKTYLRGGKSYAAAQGLALSAVLALRNEPKEPPLPKDLPALLAAPNNILAISYLRALRRLCSPMQPLPVLRAGDYHARELPSLGFPSATGVRAAILRGDKARAEAACGYPLPAGPICQPHGLDSALLFCLRQMDKQALLRLPDCSEGLENLVQSTCREATSRRALLDALKSKRYTHARLSRLLTHALLGITRELQEAYPLPVYARLLGFRKESRPMLRALRESGIDIISKAADGPLRHPAYMLDAAAYDLWALGAKIPAGLMLRQPVQIL